MGRSPLGATIMLVAAASARPAAADITGTVVDTGGAPVAGAHVAQEGVATITATTDGAGAFALAVPDARVTITAGAKGYFYASTRLDAPASGVVLTLEAVPLDDDPSYAFRTAADCIGCHQDQVEDWTDSPMARAGINTWLYDLYDGSGTPGGAGGFVYQRDSVLAADDPESECASCHQPEPWAAEPFVGLLPIDEAATAQHGVSCEVCHRIADLDETKPNFPGLYPGVVRMARSATAEPVMFGALGDVAFANSQMRPSYQPQLTAAVCAVCHQDKNDPDRDGDFEEDDGVISEPTYLEWLESSYADPTSPDAATCAGCHMVATGASSACSVYAPAELRTDGQIRSHRIEGTTAAFLEAAVTARVTVTQDGDQLIADVEVENDRTGHHVPTGVTVRNVILLVEAVDAGGRTLASTGDQVVDALGGVGDPADGYFAGLPGKLYAKVPVDAEGDAPTFFTDAVALASDNRIAAHAIDRTRYAFAAPPEGGAVTVTARVIYRRAFRALVDAKGWTEDGHGRPLADLAAPNFGHLMASAEATIEATPADGGCGCQGGGGGGGAALGALAALALWGRRRRDPTVAR